MNAKINALIKQSYVTVQTPSGEETTYFSQEKFAELIVKECAKVARSQTLEKYPGMKSEYDGIVYVEEAIKKHFGVEA